MVDTSVDAPRLPDIVTEALLLNRYGPRLTLVEVARLMRISASAAYNQLSAGEFPIATYSIGARKFCDYRDVARYFNDCFESARRNRQAKENELALLRKARKKGGKIAAP
jgi:hypothetical protein